MPTIISPFDAYQESLTWVHKPAPDALTYTILGIAGECGEVVEAYKKAMRSHQPEDIRFVDEVRDRLIDEMGDVLWYIAKAAKELDVSLSIVVKRNLLKMTNRSIYGKQEDGS